MSSDRSLGSRIGSVAQDCVQGVTVRLLSVVRDGACDRCIVRLRLCRTVEQPSEGWMSATPIDSSVHRKVAECLRDHFPLATTTCFQNVLDAQHEIEVTVPSSQDAWTLAASRQKCTTFERVLWQCCVACLFAISGIVCREHIETAVHAAREIYTMALQSPMVEDLRDRPRGWGV